MHVSNGGIILIMVTPDNEISLVMHFFIFSFHTISMFIPSNKKKNYFQIQFVSKLCANLLVFYALKNNHIFFFKSSFKLGSPITQY